MIVSLLLAGALLNDNLAKRLRIIGAVAIPVAALFALLFNDVLFSSVPRSADVGYASMLAIISIVYWCRTATIANLLGIHNSGPSWLAAGARNADLGH